MEQRALAERPDYRAAQQSLRLAEANVKLAEAYGTTDPTLGGEYDRSGNDNSGGFQVNIPLRIFDRNQGEKERTRYEAQSSRFAEIAARNQVINDVDQAWAAYQTAQRTVAALQRPLSCTSFTCSRQPRVQLPPRRQHSARLPRRSS